MKMKEIKETIKSLASSQGFYGRLLASIETMEEMFPQDYKKLAEELESQNFQNAVDLIMYIECLVKKLKIFSQKFYYIRIIWYN